MNDFPTPRGYSAAPSAETSKQRLERLLSGRILFQQTARWRPHLPEYISNSSSGVVMTGSNAGRRAVELRETGYEGTLLIDDAAYMEYTACVDAPFRLPEDQIFSDLESHLAVQRDQSADFAITPTGYIQAADSRTLKTIVTQCAEIQRDDVIVALPVDIGWFQSDHVKQLIAACKRIRHPKALVLVGQRDPLRRFNAAPANLRKLLSESEQVAVIRTDLAAFDAVVHGAMFAAIGASSSLRHAVPAGERPQSGPFPNYPHVLLPQLMLFKSAQSLATLYATAYPPTCGCTSCQGKPLDRFHSCEGETRIAAEAHNAASWGAWLPELSAFRNSVDRCRWWKDKCQMALDSYEMENVRIEQPGGLEPPKPLKAWASLPLDDSGESSPPAGADT